MGGLLFFMIVFFAFAALGSFALTLGVDSRPDFEDERACMGGLIASVPSSNSSLIVSPWRAGRGLTDSWAPDRVRSVSQQHQCWYVATRAPCAPRR